MKLGKITRKLRREAASNPKKAVFLGVAALVALYFWVPLVWGWAAKNKESQQATAGAAAMPAAMPPLASAPIVPATTDKAAAPGQPSWQQIVRWMRKDPRTMIAPVLAPTRDPFEAVKTEAADMNAEVKTKPKPPVVSPDKAGLVLTSTIIGPQRRVVQISGKTYAAGQTIEVAKEKESFRATFKLIEIHPRRAVLEAEGERFELTIPEPGKSGKIELLGAAGGG